MSTVSRVAITLDEGNDLVAELVVGHNEVEMTTWIELHRNGIMLAGTTALTEFQKSVLRKALE
jgi:hypothetical protein